MVLSRSTSYAVVPRPSSHGRIGHSDKRSVTGETHLRLVDAPADAPIQNGNPILTAPAFCRRASLIKARISINNLRASWLFRSRSRRVILYRFTMPNRSRLPSWILDQYAQKWGSRKEEGRSLLWDKTEVDRAPQRSRPFIWKRDGTRGILKNVDAKDFLRRRHCTRTRPRTEGTIREQPGEENSPDDTE
jgi:hypothetical protein